MTPIVCNQDSTQPLAQDIAVTKMPPSGVLERLPVRHMLDAARARATARKLAGQLGYDLIDQLRLAAATFELAQFLTTWTGKGELFILWYKNTQGMGLKCCGCCAEPPAIYLTNNEKPAPEPDFSKLKKIVDKFEYLEDPRRSGSVVVTVWLEHSSQPEI